jgi:hypothetical protein
MAVSRLNVLPGLADQTQRVLLDGVEVTLRLYYHGRDGSGRWYCDASLSDGHQLWRGRKVLPGVGLSLRLADARWPGGLLVPAAAVSDQSPPAWGELGPGLRVELLYLDSDEVAAAREALGVG